MNTDELVTWLLMEGRARNRHKGSNAEKHECEQAADTITTLRQEVERYSWQPIEGDPTQFADEVAAKMRTYYDEHVGDPWKEGTADDLMLGLLNIAWSARSLSGNKG